MRMYCTLKLDIFEFEYLNLSSFHCTWYLCIKIEKNYEINVKDANDNWLLNGNNYRTITRNYRKSDSARLFHLSVLRRIWFLRLSRDQGHLCNLHHGVMSKNWPGGIIFLTIVSYVKQILNFKEADLTCMMILSSDVQLKTIEWT